MYSVLDVCRVIIEHSNKRDYGVSNLKLQKLLYFVQAYFLANTETHEPCFRERIEAWDFGPVVPEAYQEYRKYGSSDIPSLNYSYYFDRNNMWNSQRLELSEVAILDEDKKRIKRVVDEFKDYTSTDLVNLTHSQSPWRKTYARFQNNEITNDFIRGYFENGR